MVDFLCGDAKSAESLDDHTSVQNAVSQVLRCPHMAQIVATMKVFPTDINIDFSKLKESIRESLPKDAYIYRFDEEPIAFGLVALIAHIVMPESHGGELERIEDTLRKIDGVSEVEVILVRRI